MQSISQAIWKLWLVLCLLGTADLAAAATREFSGSVYQAGTDFGGSPYCNYHVELSSISHAISLSSDLTSVLGSSLSGTHTETGLNGCPYASPPSTTFQYAMTSYSIVGDNISIQYVSVANPNFPQGIAYFTGTKGITCGFYSCFNSITGTLTFTRTDQGSPLNWTVSSYVSLVDVTPAYVLNVNLTGAGFGSVSSSPGSIYCYTAPAGTAITVIPVCSEEFSQGTGVTLTAVPYAGSTFTGWSSPQCGAMPTCTVTMDDARSITASFALQVTTTTYPLTVSKTGGGSGRIISSPSGIDCGTQCRAYYAFGTSVTLTAQPDSGSTFGGWSNPYCGLSPTCTIVITGDGDAATATFNNTSSYGLRVSEASGSGPGKVTANTGAISCFVAQVSAGSFCYDEYPSGTNVTLTATPNPGYSFGGWSGDCTGTGGCTVSMTSSKNVSVLFIPSSLFGVSVNKAGTGSGTVTGTGINCGTDCSESYPVGTAVTLTATADSGSYFAGWSGDCTGAGACIVTMDMAKNVTATFKTAPFAVSTSGAVTVSPSPATITTNITFNPSDVGKQGSVFVTALVPVTGLSTLGITNTAATNSGSFVLVQKTSSGWQLVVNGQLIPYASGVMGEQLAALSILNSTNTSALAGTQICLGYGANAGEMVTAGRMLQVATITDTNSASSTATGSCNVTDIVVEFYNKDLDHYFVTADANEAAAIDSGKAGAGWSRTGNSFRSGGSTPVCRFYGSQFPGPNSHFYTLQGAECDGLKQLQASTPATQKRWNFESLDFISTPPSSGSCPSGTVPVYRAYNNGYGRGIDSNHRITSNSGAIQEAVSRGWSNEGIIMCAPL